MKRPTTRIIIRGWKNGKLEFEEQHEAKLGDGDVLGATAERHATQLADAPHMIEIEFVEEPNPLQRYIRFGTDPTMMAKPIRIENEEP